jgi:hypothetical protein
MSRLREEQTVAMSRPHPAKSPVPRWLRFVLVSDRAGSSWYIGTGFFFAPVLAALSPWPAITALVWVIISLAGLWLGLLGLAMAAGLAVMLRSGTEIPQDFWRSLLDGRAHRTPAIRRLTHGVTAKTPNPTPMATAPVTPK